MAPRLAFFAFTLAIIGGSTLPPVGLAPKQPPEKPVESENPK